MMNLTFKTSKSLLLFKRACVLLCFVLCSLMANANNTKWTPVYQVKTTSSSRSTGQGKVYVQSGTVKSSEEELSVKEEKTIQLRGSEKTISSSNSSTYSHTFSEITLYAVPADGSTFEGWDEDPTPSKTSVLLETTYTWTNRSGNNVVTEGDYVLPESPKHYHPIFTARIYEAYSPFVGIITLDAEGNVSAEVGGSVSLDGTNWSTDLIEAGTLLTKSADSEGKYARATFEHRFQAQPKAGYKFVGWAVNPQEPEASYKTRNLNPYQVDVVSTCEQGSNDTPPSTNGFYAVFRPSLTYYYSGPKVYVSNNEPEGGDVYVHSTRAADKPASVDAVATANWKKSHDDNATTYTQKDTATYSYTYYAKPSDPTKYAFKGWATSQFSDPTYGTDPIDPMFDYDLTMSAENTKPENRYITPPLFAVFESFYYKVPPAALATASQGAGYVYVDLTGSGMPSGYTGTEVTAGALNQVAANGVQHNYTVHYYVAPIPGNVFVGWSTTADGLNIINQKAHYEAEYASQAKNRD